MINSIAKEANFAYNGAQEMGFSLSGGKEGGEHISVGFVEISEIFAMQEAFFIGMISLG